MRKMYVCMKIYLVKKLLYMRVSIAKKLQAYPNISFVKLVYLHMFLNYTL